MWERERGRRDSERRNCEESQFYAWSGFQDVRKKPDRHPPASSPGSSGCPWTNKFHTSMVCRICHNNVWCCIGHNTATEVNAKCFSFQILGCEQQTASYRWQYDCDNMQTDEQLSVTASRHFSCTLRTQANRGTNGRLVTSSNLSLVTVTFRDAIAKLSSLGWLSTRGRQGLKRKATGGMGDQQHRPRPGEGRSRSARTGSLPSLLTSRGRCGRSQRRRTVSTVDCSARFGVKFLQSGQV